MHIMEMILLAVIVLVPVADRLLDSGKPRPKSTDYIQLAAVLWLATALLVACFWQGALTVSAPAMLPDSGGKAIFALLIGIAFISYLIYAVASIKRNDTLQRQVAESFRSGGPALIRLLPGTRKEYLLFTGLVSVTAGICEELIFRWYVYSFIDQHAHSLVAVAVSSLLFGTWHVYLGWKYACKTVCVGAFLCAVYIYFDSILVAMAFHILMDVYAGSIAFYARAVPDATVGGQ